MDRSSIGKDAFDRIRPSLIFFRMASKAGTSCPVIESSGFIPLAGDGGVLVGGDEVLAGSSTGDLR